MAAVQERLLSKALYSSLPLMFLGLEFSAPEAVSIFSVVLDRPVLKTSMRQRLLKMTEAGYLQEFLPGSRTAQERPSSNPASPNRSTMTCSSTA